jgi:hypothetical protein
MIDPCRLKSYRPSNVVVGVTGSPVAIGGPVFPIVVLNRTVVVIVAPYGLFGRKLPRKFQYEYQALDSG